MSRRFQGGQSSERLTLTTVKNNDYLQVYHDAGGSEDSDKGLPFGIVQAQPVATCSTAAGTVAKVANIIASVSQPDFTLLNGRIVTIKMANGNTATDPTLNVNSTGALPIRLPNQASSVHVGPNCWGAGVWLQFQYVTDGSNQYWLLLGHDVATATSEYTTYSDGRIEYVKSKVDNLLGNKLDYKKLTTTTRTEFTFDGSIINIISAEADGNNQYLIVFYIYSTSLIVKSLSGNQIPTSITFTKSGSNIIVSIPAYWLVSFY